ncbi:N-acetylglucosamine-6-phosphate deacetylase [Defluviimonas sp. SAOS-178_SWC]|uniref:N-acetylglucosamine-6-phosphate deacetylase n=1 Tax=Defluviimonas sp. SAOS-178_SWC TaxID=3121287 RepID=UPI00322220B9
MTATLYHGADIFDGERLGPGALLVEDGRIAAVLPPNAAPTGVTNVDLDGGLLMPGFVDLQLNGGGGVMFNDAPCVETLATMAEAHAGLGALTMLPTLITDTPEISEAAVAAVEAAVASGMPGIAGLHLEGPHLSLARKGAHDPALIRPMGEGDLAFLMDAAKRLPRLLVTLAPESVTNAQIAALAKAGVIVSLGHTDAGFETCRAAVSSGATMATHLFNAMSQFGSREPGLVGAVLTGGAFDAGLIADGIHVHPAAIRAAQADKEGPGELFLVTDAMAPAGTSVTSFTLNGREIRRADGRLTLADGTLAGADLDMARALRVLRDDVGIALDRALGMATRIPARAARLSDRCGALLPGRSADFLHLSQEFHLVRIWRRGRDVPLSPA